MKRTTGTRKAAFAIMVFGLLCFLAIPITMLNPGEGVIPSGFFWAIAFSGIGAGAILFGLILLFLDYFIRWERGRTDDDEDALP